MSLLCAPLGPRGLGPGGGTGGRGSAGPGARSPAGTLRPLQAPPSQRARAAANRAVKVSLSPPSLPQLSPASQRGEKESVGFLWIVSVSAPQKCGSRMSLSQLICYIKASLLCSVPPQVTNMTA